MGRGPARNCEDNKLAFLTRSIARLVPVGLTAPYHRRNFLATRDGPEEYLHGLLQRLYGRLASNSISFLLGWMANVRR